MSSEDRTIGPAGPIFSAAFAGVAASLTQDVFSIKAPSSSRIRLREIRLAQYTDFGDAASEILSVQVIRGHNTAGSNAGNVTITPANIHGWSGAPSDTGTVVTRNDTGLATDTGTGNTAILMADAWNIQSQWSPNWSVAEMPILDVNQRAVVRMSVPADAVTLNGTLVYEKLGK